MQLRPTSGCSRITAARFFDYFLLAKLVYNAIGRTVGVGHTCCEGIEE